MCYSRFLLVVVFWRWAAIVPSMYYLQYCTQGNIGGIGRYVRACGFEFTSKVADAT